MVVRSESQLKKVRFRFPLLRWKSSEKGIPLEKLLAQMDAYDWQSVEDITVNEDERRKRQMYFDELIDASGIELNGSLLDLASGVISLAYLYPDTVAVDSDPQKIKRLRRDGIKGIVANIETLPFEEKSFDYVVSISPPQKTVILHRNGYVRFGVDQEYNRRLVNAALRIARKNVLIASYYIATQPLYDHLIEKKDTNGHYYVFYRASDGSTAQR